MFLKSLVKTVLISAGKRFRMNKARIPVELSADEVGLIDRIISSQLSMVSPERLWATMMACKHVVDQNIAGDFVECGVWRGGNALIAASVFKAAGIRKKVYLFDTFKGMTEPGSMDVAVHTGKAAVDRFRQKQRQDHNDWCFATLQDVKNNFEKLGLMSDDIHFVEGDVMETLKVDSNIPQQISLLRLDTDWYDSTKLELELLYPRLNVGGILIIDDYGHWAGAKQATDEYFSSHGPRPFLQYTDRTGRMAVKFG
jgi:O-methyltransferase